MIFTIQVVITRHISTRIQQQIPVVFRYNEQISVCGELYPNEITYIVILHPYCICGRCICNVESGGTQRVKRSKPSLLKL